MIFRISGIGVVDWSYGLFLVCDFLVDFYS